MFAAADRMPVMVKASEIMVDPLISGVSGVSQQPFVTLYPNPSSKGLLFVQSSQGHTVRIFDMKGRQLDAIFNKSGNYELNIGGTGVFLVQFEGSDGRVQTEKILVQ